MSDKQLLFILEKKYSGCEFQSITWNAGGNMIVSYRDKNGNKHEEMLTVTGTVTTFDI